MEFAKYKRQINVSDYYKMAEVGILKREEKLELLHGEIIEKFPHSRRHIATVNRLNSLVGKVLGGQAILSIKHPLRIDEYNEAEPDIAVLEFREDYYSSAHPQPNQVLWLIEVAESSLNFDREIKAPLYAKAGIPIYWILDLDTEQVGVYSNPDKGQYTLKTLKKEGDKLEIPGLKLEISVSDIFF